MMKKEKYNTSYNQKYINEIKLYLKFNYGIDKINVDLLVSKFQNMLETDPSYVFHYDSEYWAKYIVEASGLTM